MAAAMEYLGKIGYECQDNSAVAPYDLVASKGGQQCFVEVKGTSAGGDQVILTKNEVQHAQAHPGQSVLFILHDIKVGGTADRPTASGGVQRVIWPWVPGDADLTALSYQYRVSDRSVPGRRSD